MFTRRPRLLPCLCAALVNVCSSFPPASAQPAPDCPETSVAPVQVPNLRRALAADTGLVVVAVGSSSTQGAMASSRARSYPAVLQAELEAALPRSHVAVLNRGIGGQDVVEQLARLDADVIAVRPALVVWQIGANAVLRRMEPEAFKRLVAAGVRRLHAAGADVVLVDNQRAPAILDTPGHERIVRALAEAAVETGAGLFSRDALMARWERDGHPREGFIAPDGLHHNDRGYRCIARALAAAVLEGLDPPGTAHAASVAARR